MKVLYYDLNQREDLEAEYPMTYVDLDTLLRESDFVSLHTVLNDSTHHLISDAALATMKASAVLVNAARGPIVDPAALYRALSDGQIAAAGLDVTDPEPIPMGRPAAHPGQLRGRAPPGERERGHPARDVEDIGDQPAKRDQGR